MILSKAYSVFRPIYTSMNAVIDINISTMFTAGAAVFLWPTPGSKHELIRKMMACALPILHLSAEAFISYCSATRRPVAGRGLVCRMLLPSSDSPSGPSGGQDS